MLTNKDFLIVTTAEAKALIEGLNKLVPDDKADRYDVLQKAGLLTLYDEFREALKTNERTEASINRWYGDNRDDD